MRRKPRLRQTPKSNRKYYYYLQPVRDQGTGVECDLGALPSIQIFEPIFAEYDIAVLLFNVDYIVYENHSLPKYPTDVKDPELSLGAIDFNISLALRTSSDGPVYQQAQKLLDSCFAKISDDLEKAKRLYAALNTISDFVNVGVDRYFIDDGFNELLNLIAYSTEIPFIAVLTDHGISAIKDICSLYFKMAEEEMPFGPVTGPSRRFPGFTPDAQASINPSSSLGEALAADFNQAIVDDLYELERKKIQNSRVEYE